MMHTPSNLTVPRPRRAAGYTLVEILLALGIFMIGMTAVVSLFPVAALLQRETASDILTAEAASSAKALVQAETFTYGGANTGNIGAYHPTAGSTNALVSSAIAFFPYTDRSYPSSQIIGTARTDASNCDLFWVPFIQDLNGDPANTNWIVRILILEGDSSASYTNTAASALGTVANGTDPNYFPKVVRTTCTVVDEDTFTFGINAESNGIEGGSVFIDNNGTNYIVSDVDGTSVSVTSPILTSPATPTHVWLAPALGGRTSPLKRIVTVAPNVTAP